MTAAARAWEAEADVRDAASTPLSCRPRSYGQRRYHHHHARGDGQVGRRPVVTARVPSLPLTVNRNSYHRAHIAFYGRGEPNVHEAPHV